MEVYLKSQESFDEMPQPPTRPLHALVLYLTWHGNSKLVAERIRDRLIKRWPEGSTVAVRDFIEDYGGGSDWSTPWKKDLNHGLDAVVIGGSMHAGKMYTEGMWAAMTRHAPSISKFLTDPQVKHTMANIPTLAFWSVGITPCIVHKTDNKLEPPTEADNRARTYLLDYIKETGYSISPSPDPSKVQPMVNPELIETFAGGFQWTKMPWYLRFGLHKGFGREEIEMPEESEKFGKKVVGVWREGMEAPVDIKRDYLWTDFAAVDAFADRIADDAMNKAKSRI